MLLVTKFYINQRLISAIWFRYIFLTYPYLFFFTIQTSKLSDLSVIFETLSNLQVNFKFFNKFSYIFDNTFFFNCINSKFFVIYTNSFDSYLSVTKFNNLLSLSLVSVNGYFLNNVFFFNLHNFYKFFNDNYLFYQSFLFYFIMYFIKFILRLKLTLILSINSFLKF